MRRGRVRLPPGKCKFVEHRAGAAGSGWQVTRRGVRRVDGVTCEEDAQDWWFAPADAARPRQKLVTLCNNSYGAAGVGEDELEVKGTTHAVPLRRLGEALDHHNGGAARAHPRARARRPRIASRQRPHRDLEQRLELVAVRGPLVG
ncbi:MAG: hypothetical protein INH41_14455 [Myxococcaceae bacterium]|nr:hypothetical protein [Myxococcaceae bacterium]